MLFISEIFIQREVMQLLYLIIPLPSRSAPPTPTPTPSSDCVGLGLGSTFGGSASLQGMWQTFDK